MNPAAILAFSLIAALAVGVTGRRDAAGNDRISAFALLMLLVLPALALLPGWSLPTPAGISARETPAIPIGGPLLAGSAVCLIRLLVSARQLRVRIASSRRIGHRTTADGRRIEIRVAPRITSPCAAGLSKPVILLPPQWFGEPPARREMILAHELAHHGRRDPLWRWIAALSCSLHWWNPLVWWLARRHALQAELACDAAVLAAGVSREGYAHLLCDIARSRPVPLVSALNAPALAIRIGRLRRPRQRLSRAALGGALALLVLAGLACGTGRRAEAVPATEVELRLTADPFPDRH